MYVRNRTSLCVALRRGALADDLSIGCVVITTAYSVTEKGLTLLAKLPDPAKTDPPDISGHVLVRGCSVTAAGTVYGPPGPPFVKGVTFKIGAETRRLAVFGERVWRADMFGDLAATEPAPFESIPLSFDNAFGGFFVVPPGLAPGSMLPHPGGKVVYPLNDHGIGFYKDRESATGSRLPFIELADKLMTKWTDQPEPGGFSPCPELPALRHLRALRNAPPIPPGKSPPLELTQDLIIEGLFLGPHHAPGALIFDSVPTGTLIELSGAGKAPIRFELLAPPARVFTRRREERKELQPVARSIHVDADRRLVLCVHGYEFGYKESTAPSWVLIEGVEPPT